MHSFSGYTANQLYWSGINAVQKEGLVQHGRIEQTKELTHVVFELTEPRNRLISMRDINPAFAWVEVLWIMAGGNSVKYLEFWNKRMWDYADKKSGTLYGAYGHRLGNHWFWLNNDMNPKFDEDVSNSLYTSTVDYNGPNQMYQALYALAAKPASRQVVLQIWNKDDDLPFSLGVERAKDVPCNVMSHLMLREDKLTWLQVMRSNDAVWGWPYNIIQWTFLQEIMAGWLGVDSGPFILLSDSFHVYEKHWDKLQPILDRFNEYEELYASVSYGLPFDESMRSFRIMVEAAFMLTTCPLGDEHNLVLGIFNVCDLRYMGLMGMLAAEAMRIKGAPLINCIKVIDNMAGSDPYWRAAWTRWAKAKAEGSIL